jgi:hypothetical protein
VALVMRGYQPLLNPTSLPTGDAFNHAIVFARDPAGQTYWIDPTNRASFAQGTFEDIIDRPSLVLNPKTPALAQIPAADPSGAVVTTKLEVDLSRDGMIRNRGSFDLRGRSVLAWTGVGLNRSKEDLSYSIITNMAKESRLKEWNVEDFDLSSRVARDLLFEFKYAEAGTDLRTSAGSGYMLNAPGSIYKFRPKIDDRVSDVYLGQPYTYRREITFDGIARVGTEELGCRIESPWMTASREARDTEHGMVLTDEYVLKRNVLTLEELRTPEFRQLRDTVEHCFDRIALVYRRLGEPGVRKLSSD